MKKYLSIKEMEKLKRLGIDTSNSSMVYVKYGLGIKCVIRENIKEEDIICDTFILQDILEILPSKIIDNKGIYHSLSIWMGYEYGWAASYEGCISFVYNNNILITAYKILCKLAKNGYIKTKLTKL